MKKFLFLFKGLDGSAQPITESYGKKWVDYMAQLTQGGHLEAGSPLESAGKVVVGKDQVSDFQGDKVDIYGYMLIKASSLEEAVKLSQQAPHMALGGTTIVRTCKENA